MPHSFSKLLTHLVFSTKYRAPLIAVANMEGLHRYVAAAVRAHGCAVHSIGGTENHLHICCSLARIITCARLVEEIKVDSSKWMKTQERSCMEFAWQNGYGAFSLGESQLEALCRYIDSQQEHHAKLSYEEEFRQLLRQHGQIYDERYMWD